MKKDTLASAVDALRTTINALRTDPPKRTEHVDQRLDRMLGMMPLFPDQFLYVVNYSEGKVAYTRGFEEVLGYAGDEVDVEFLYGIWHPDDAPIVARLTQAVIQAMAGLRRPLDPFELTLTVDYRVRKANGQYIKVLRQTAVFDVDEISGKVISTFSLCKDISTIKSSNRIGWQVRGLRSGEVDLRGLVDQLPKLQYRPSEREMDVIRKMAEGKGSKQIASELGISLHTVNTHRKNLLERMGVMNGAAVVNSVIEMGWL